MDEFTSLPPEFHRAAGEITPPGEEFTGLSLEFSHLESAPPTAPRSDWKGTVKKLLAAGAAVAAASWGVLGGLGDIGGVLAPKSPPQPPPAAVEVITPGDAPGETAADPPDSQPAMAQPTAGPSAEPTADPALGPGETPEVPSGDADITPGNAGTPEVGENSPVPEPDSPEPGAG